MDLKNEYNLKIEYTAVGNCPVRENDSKCDMKSAGILYIEKIAVAAPCTRHGILLLTHMLDRDVDAEWWSYNQTPKRHTPECERCKEDLLLYGEAYFNLRTKEHIDVSEVVRVFDSRK
jgi:hypothetical protein